MFLLMFHSVIELFNPTHISIFVNIDKNDFIALEPIYKHTYPITKPLAQIYQTHLRLRKFSLFKKTAVHMKFTLHLNYSSND